MDDWWQLGFFALIVIFLSLTLHLPLGALVLLCKLEIDLGFLNWTLDSLEKRSIVCIPYWTRNLFPLNAFVVTALYKILKRYLLIL
jgi:hypothetical protein